MTTELLNDMTTAEPQVALYSKEYFIRKFEAIHEDFWCVKEYEDGCGAKCALGHCGEQLWDSPEEASALRALWSDGGATCLPIGMINDGKSPRYQQPTPKARILAALRDLPDTK